MNTNTNQTAAFNAGVEFAKFLNDNPNERQNWGQLSREDGIPEGDYAELTREFGECNSDMENQFRAGFNKTLCK